MKRIIRTFTPSKGFKLPAIIITAILIGLGAYTFKASNAISYLSDAPETCINCHVMIPEYASWQHSSHRENATCNDCHVPHDNVVSKYLFKATDGLRHATIFTLRGEAEVIQIKEAGATVVQNNCKRCHSHVNENVSIKDDSFGDVHTGNSRECWSCHREIPHGRVKGLSSTPNAKLPAKEVLLPKWLQNLKKNNTIKP